MSQKTPKYNVVEITTPDGKKLEYFVRHLDPRQARSNLLDDKVEARVASQTDMVRMVESKAHVYGLPEIEPDTQPLPLAGGATQGEAAQ